MLSSRNFVWIVTGIICTSMVLGCGSGSGPTRAAVSGSVTVDGVPLEEGVATFIPDQGTEGPTSGAKILHGQYEIPAEKGPVLGTYRVEVTARKTESGKSASPESEQPTTESSPSEVTLIQYIPAKYNTQSTLTLDVQAGSNQFDIPIELEKN